MTDIERFTTEIQNRLSEIGQEDFSVRLVRCL